MLRFAGRLYGSYSQVSPSSNTLLRKTHVNTFSLRGNEVTALARYERHKTLLLSRASRQDRVLTASMGLVSGGLVVTAALTNYEKGFIISSYQDALDGFYRGNKRQNHTAVKYIHAKIDNLRT